MTKPTQLDRFKQAAIELECNTSDKALDKAFARVKVDQPPTPKKAPKAKRAK